MSEYKAAKEAFVSDNPGSSILQINLTSATALSAYALYALAVRRFQQSPFRDYVTTVLPLLFAITVAATRPITLNIVLLLSSLALYLASRPVSALHSNGHAPGVEQRSKGKWLDESDSDEEAAEPVSASSSSHTGLNRLETVSGPSSALSPSPSPVDGQNLSPEKAGSSARTWKRRHSPTPSTHTHTAIDILHTPELLGSRAMSSAAASYPSRRGRGDRNEDGGKFPFLSVYRAHMMVMTVHCILAVDFPVFPRWQGKCENFGTSLMDVGVGSFVFSLGLVSIKLYDQAAGQSVLASVVKALRKSSPVLALGLVRVLMIKGSEYPEHVTEYGVHWNFFFTLGLLPVLTTLLAPLRRTGLDWTIVAGIVSVVHQVLLGQGLQAWVMSDLRNGIVGQNKEGVVSLPGYFAIYILGLATGRHVMRASMPIRSKAVTQTSTEYAQSQTEKRRAELAMELFGYAIGWWCLLGMSVLAGGAVSRRLANLPYILWIAAYNTCFLLGYLVLEIILFPAPSPSHAAPPLLEAINRNGLVIFLIANLMTGLVNVSMKTMFAGDSKAMALLVAYSIGISGVAWAMRRVRLKL